MFFDNAYLDAITKGALFSILGLAWIIFLVRVIGLRAFSKMTNFDFVTTVATGSLLASMTQTSEPSSLVQVLVGLACLSGVQYVVSMLRHRSAGFDRLVQNTPKLLVHDGEILTDALRETRVTRDDLISKLREANVADLADVRAVILETTGSVSVLHGSELDPELLTGVTRV